LCQVGGFLRVLRFPPQYNWNIFESGVKHQNPNPSLMRSPILQWKSGLKRWPDLIRRRLLYCKISNKACYMRPSLNISRFFFFQERHDALEQMGVSVETSGIKVETGKYFLVNLNADPSLNELLVYYLKVGENISFYRIFNFFLCVDFVSF
jgi:hypothetical protein